MAGGQLQRVVRFLRGMAAAPKGDAPSDARLLEQFAACRDETAFAELLQRHGPMVLSVCRRVLGDAHDAEDAFQATFLVLARKAASIRKQASVGSWLYGVALRVAQRAKLDAARRRRREAEVAAPRPEEAPDPALADVRPVLDEELGRLPEKYRALVVLCYLEGKTNDEAAQLLGWPKGTVSGRLARARDLLRGRLTRRGLAVSGAVVAAALAEGTTSAVPAALADVTLKAAGLIAAGKTAAGVVSAPVVALTEGVLQAMFLSKMRTAGVVLACLVLLGAGVGVLAYQKPAVDPGGAQAAAPAPEEKKKEEPPAPAKDNAEVQALLKERLEVAKHGYAAARQEYEAGATGSEALVQWSEKVLEAELDRTDKKDERLALLKKHIERLQDAEEIQKARYDAGRVSIKDYDAAKLARIEAQLRLAREKVK